MMSMTAATPARRPSVTAVFLSTRGGVLAMCPNR